MPKNNRLQQEKIPDDWKQKTFSLDENIQKMVTGRMKISPGAPTKVNKMEFTSAIVKILITGSAAHERQRSEVIQRVKTLDQLTAALCSKGFDLRLSSFYLQLISRNVRSIEGKRHVDTAPVKLLRLENSKHSSHIGAMFASSTIQHLEEVARFLGPEEVIFHSQDDKIKVPIGLTAANKQALLVMHTEYKVKLPDHGFVIAKQHKLVPSVIGDMQVKAKTFSSDAVTYSGPTYIGI